MAEQWEIDRAFRSGRQIGRLEKVFGGLPRDRLLPGAEFGFRRSLFDSYAAYERDVVLNLRKVQQLRWLRHQELRRSPDRPPMFGADEAELEAIEAKVVAELWKVREAVDAEREEGRGRACVVEALRASPQTPPQVAEYGRADEFAAEDPRRRLHRGTGWVDLGGADFGSRWGLENPFRRWEVTRWRISWICETDRFMWSGNDALHSDAREATTEVYACELLDRSVSHGNGRVWLLGKLRTRAAVDRALGDLSRYAIGERNSLVAAADSVARVSREEGWAEAE